MFPEAPVINKEPIALGTVKMHNNLFVFHAVLERKRNGYGDHLSSQDDHKDLAHTVKSPTNKKQSSQSNHPRSGLELMNKELTLCI